MNVVPLQDRILVEPIEEEKITAFGIIIPEKSQDKPSQGKVLSTGKGRRRNDGTYSSLSVKPDDIVLYGRYAGSEIKIKGKDYLILREDDILGIIQ